MTCGDCKHGQKLSPEAQKKWRQEGVVHCAFDKYNEMVAINAVWRACRLTPSRWEAKS